MRNILLLEVISKLGLWPKVEEGSIFRTQEHASERIPQSFSGGISEQFNKMVFVLT